MLTYPLYYRNRGIRLIQQLTRPVTTPLSHLVLPVGSIYHYFSHNPNEVSVDPDDIMIQMTKPPIVVDHVVDMLYTTPLGNPRAINLQSTPLIQAYHVKYKQFKRMSANLGMLKQPRTLLVVGYNLVAAHYRYVENYQTNYNKWVNLYRTMLVNIGNLAVSSERQQFIHLEIPAQLPPISLLSRFVDGGNRTLLDRFDTDALRFIADLWHWLGEDRDTVSPGLAMLNDEALNKLNLVFTHGGIWSVVNLGVLNSWRIGGDGRVHGAGLTKLAPAVIQRRVLRLLMAIVETGTVGVDKDTAVDEVDTPATDVAEVTSAADIDTTLTPVETDPVRIADYGLAIPTGGAVVSGVNKQPIRQTLGDIIKTGASDKTTDMPDTAALPEYSDADIDRDLAQLEVIEQSMANDRLTAYKPYTPPGDDIEDGIKTAADAVARVGMLSAAEHRRITRLASRYKDIRNPYRPEGRLDELLTITPADLEVKLDTPIAAAISGVTEPSMLSSSLTKFDRSYINNVLPKDIATMVVNLQRAGIVVQDYQIQRVDDYSDSFEIHTVKLVPVVGKPTTVRFQIPRVNESGTFKAGGVQYRMRKQRGDIPIRKTAPDTVALTSYYSKMFVVRSERAVFNYSDWLVNNIVSRGIDADDKTVMDIRMADGFNHLAHLPRTYTTVSKRVVGWRTGEYAFSFDWDSRNAFFGEDIVNTIVKTDTRSNMRYVPVARYMDGVLVMDTAGVMYRVSLTDAKAGMVAIGTLEAFLGLPLDKKPVEIAEVDIFGKTIPVGFILAHQIGLGNLIATLGVEVRRVRTGSTYNLTDDEYMVRFEDEVIIGKRSDAVAALVLGGFNRYHRETKRYSVYAFDKQDIYGNVLEANGIGARHLREFELMFKLWVDPITRGLLIDMHEPTDLFRLFISACDKLTYDHHPAQMDTEHMRDKGYERISGMVYFELVKAMRTYSARPMNANASVDLNPQAVWMSMLQDQTVMPIEESNPIHALKEQEVVVFGGGGGRTGRSMTEKHRGFHRSNVGLVSEATVDSGDVATITYLTADPNYTSLRGTSRQMTDADLTKTPSKVVSTSMLMSPGASHDDAKRVNFISVQNSQTTHCTHHTPMPMRTGYERVLAHRSDALFAKTAEWDGVVTQVTDKTVSVKYANDDVVTYEIGTRFGNWAGHVIPHTLVTGLKTGSKVKKGDVLLYNTKYFTPDTLDPSQVIVKTGVLGRVALLEATDTLEDSCALSVPFANKLTTMSTHVRSIKVTFDQEVRNLLKVGEDVTPESILCTIHNASTGNTDLFDDAAITTLGIISASTPTAKHAGVIERIEVLYTGELEDMSATIRSLAERSDSDIRRLNKELGRRAVDGRVDVGFRVDGHPLELDAAVIRVYVTGPTGMGVGDKCVFGSQMKSIVGRVMTGVNETEDGVAIDAIFGYQSIVNRIVLSAELIGTTSSLLDHVGQLAVKAYRSK